MLSAAEPWAFFVEDECSASGEVVPVATIFLTNRECPWRCVMCDLSRNTLKESVPPGAIPRQIDFALERLPAARHLKLYNSGSFFDPRAIPVDDYAAIAQRTKSFERVIVESHPALVRSAAKLKELLAAPLEVAMGLETVHPEVLPKLNKGMTLDQYKSASEWLRKNDIALRSFILVKPPFTADREAVEWAAHSVDFAFDCGSTAATLIPTRGDAPPTLAMLEAALDYGIEQKRGRVFADLWDVKNRGECEFCFSARFDRLREINLRQKALARPACEKCTTLPL